MSDVPFFSLIYLLISSEWQWGFTKVKVLPQLLIAIMKLSPTHFFTSYHCIFFFSGHSISNIFFLHSKNFFFCFFSFTCSFLLFSKSWYDKKEGPWMPSDFAFLSIWTIVMSCPFLYSQLFWLAIFLFHSITGGLILIWFFLLAFMPS